VHCRGARFETRHLHLLAWLMFIEPSFSPAKHRFRKLCHTHSVYKFYILFTRCYHLLLPHTVRHW